MGANFPASGAQEPLTRILGAEHGLIRRGTRLLARYCAHLRAAGELDPGLANTFVRFFRVYLGEHHKKEEELLFPWLERHGVRREGGPLSILVAEHEEGRVLLEALAAINRVAEKEPADPEAIACFSAFGERLARLLLEHDWKEDHLLYPLAELLDAETQELRAANPEGFRSCLEDPEEFQRWVDDIEGLACSWPPSRLSFSRARAGDPAGRDPERPASGREGQAPAVESG